MGFFEWLFGLEWTDSSGTTHRMLSDKEMEENRKRDRERFKRSIAGWQEASYIPYNNLSTRPCCFTGQLECDMDCDNCPANPNNWTEEKRNKWLNGEIQPVVLTGTGLN